MEYDFTHLYDIYPRHRGKLDGMKKLKRTVKTIVDYRRFERAVKNYCEEVRREQLPPKYMLYWSTFCNGRWEDYVDIHKEQSGNASMAERILKGEL